MRTDSTLPHSTSNPPIDQLSHHQTVLQISQLIRPLSPDESAEFERLLERSPPLVRTAWPLPLVRSAVAWSGARPMRAPDPSELGQGVAHRQCAGCNARLTIAPTGRTKVYCSDQCRKEASRKRAATALAASPNRSLHCLPNKIRSRNPRKTLTKSTGQKSAFSTLDPDERRELIRIAHEVEFSARWPLSGLKNGGGR